MIIALLLALAGPAPSRETIRELMDQSSARYGVVIDCVWDRAKPLVVLHESASDIVDAAITLCDGDVHAMRDATYKLLQASQPALTKLQAETDRITEESLKKMRNQYVAMIMEFRAKFEHENPTKRPPWK